MRIPDDPAIDHEGQHPKSERHQHDAEPALAPDPVRAHQSYAEMHNTERQENKQQQTAEILQMRKLLRRHRIPPQKSQAESITSAFELVKRHGSQPYISRQSGKIPI